MNDLNLFLFFNLFLFCYGDKIFLFLFEKEKFLKINFMKRRSAHSEPDYLHYHAIGTQCQWWYVMFEGFFVPTFKMLSKFFFCLQRRSLCTRKDSGNNYKAVSQDGYVIRYCYITYITVAPARNLVKLTKFWGIGRWKTSLKNPRATRILEDKVEGWDADQQPAPRRWSPRRTTMRFVQQLYEMRSVALAYINLAQRRGRIATDYRNKPPPGSAKRWTKQRLEDSAQVAQSKWNA